ncbi:hypothetical protein G5B27_02835 [Fusicatenibacter saccharivorans]|uniref:Uncharacterized protein n=1 Tax=Fusicatenibacter saccharivorans TaxID=1150298 RepID=A0A939CGA9_9FIRM|nr:hypothetical protein [Fusicatenibacter saccharivorans]MBS5498477.1 hypothetical protein [Blautia sp.]NSE08809.1 hypothetical protein [Fusicatenibacter saccharivorans]NSE15643.1 hypothetical protein [Fusicatenibacter saccharivorans]
MSGTAAFFSDNEKDSLSFGC